MSHRPSWDEYFMELTEVISKRSTCTRPNRSVGAMLVKNNHIIATGYNGVPKGIHHCTKESCIRTIQNVPSGQRHELCRGLHAEQNAIIQAAVLGSSIDGATLYCTTMPCVICLKMLMNAGVERIVYRDGYPDELSEEFMLACKIKIVKFPPAKEGQD